MGVENLVLLIDRLTVDSKPYFRKMLLKLAVLNTENCQTICSYISSEIVEMSIKQSTKVGKIKVHVWLSTFLGG